MQPLNSLHKIIFSLCVLHLQRKTRQKRSLLTVCIHVAQHDIQVCTRISGAFYGQIIIVLFVYFYTCKCSRMLYVECGIFIKHHRRVFHSSLGSFY